MSYFSIEDEMPSQIWGTIRHKSLSSSWVVFSYSVVRRPYHFPLEKPNVRVTLGSKITADDCARLNLGYLDPATINIDEWKDRENDGILYVPKAGEILYRLKL